MLIHFGFPAGLYWLLFFTAKAAVAAIAVLFGFVALIAAVSPYLQQGRLSPPLLFFRLLVRRSLLGSVFFYDLV